jgi:hypothetical protein
MATLVSVLILVLLLVVMRTIHRIADRGNLSPRSGVPALWRRDLQAGGSGADDVAPRTPDWLLAGYHRAREPAHPRLTPNHAHGTRSQGRRGGDVHLVLDRCG